MKRTVAVDTVFVIVLFCLFTVSVLFVLLSGATVYKNTASAMRERYEDRTALSYLSTKIQSYNARDCINIADEDVLVLSETYMGERFDTYIYLNDGCICELYIAENSDFTPESGEQIIACDLLKFDFVRDNLLRVKCDSGELYINLRS